MEPLSLLPVVLTTVGGIVWAVRLEGRVNTQERIAELQTEINDKDHKELKELVQGVDTKLDRLIERSANRS